jgi:hypothetical protein
LLILFAYTIYCALSRVCPAAVQAKIQAEQQGIAGSAPGSGSWLAHLSAWPQIDCKATRIARMGKGHDMRQFMAIVSMASMLAGCTTDPGFTGVSGVREADAAAVGQCRYVSDVSMTPGVYGQLATQGLKYARNKIMAEAQSAGANTVVFDKTSPGADVYQLHAVAYSC